MMAAGASPASAGPQAADTAGVILVVDDDTDVRELMAEFLATAGFTVVSATGGVEALRLLDERPDITLLLTDIRMPDMSGLDLASRAKAAHPDLHVILTSGYFLPQPVPHRFIRKPFRLFELESVVRAELHV